MGFINTNNGIGHPVSQEQDLLKSYYVKKQDITEQEEIFNLVQEAKLANDFIPLDIDAIFSEGENI